jgi:hypothetical protein
MSESSSREVWIGQNVSRSKPRNEVPPNRFVVGTSLMAKRFCKDVRETSETLLVALGNSDKICLIEGT